MMQKLAAIVIAIGSTTCCPSLFLSVEKTNSAPRPPMPDPQIADRQILAPSYMENRFLDEEPSADTDEFREYTDNPQDLHSLARALSSLEQLENKFGAPRTKRLDGESRSPEGGSNVASKDPEIHGNLLCNNYECQKITIPCRYLPALKRSNGSWKTISWMKGARAVKMETVDNLEGRYWRVVSRWPENSEIDQAEKICLQKKRAHVSELNKYIEDLEEKLEGESAKQVELETEIKNLEAARLQIEEQVKDMELDQRQLQRALKNSPAAISKEQLKGKLVQNENAQQAAKRKQLALDREKIIDELRLQGIEFQKRKLEQKGIRNELDQQKKTKQDMDAEIESLEGDTEKFEANRESLPPPSYSTSIEAADFVARRALPLQGQIPGDDQTEVRIMPFAGPPTLSKTLFTFVHLTDIQIRDRDIRLGNEDLSRRLDWLVEQSFEYDPELEFNNRYLVESLFATINKEVEIGKRCNAAAIGGDTPSSSGTAGTRTGDAPKGCEGRTNGDTPSFVIHTGDAIDSGVTTELDDFHRFIDRVNVPFYNVIGNHDVLTFGNLMPTRNPHSDEECASVSSIAAAKADWIRQHRYLLPNKLCVNARIRCPGCDRAHVPDLVVAGKNNDPITHANARAHFIAAFGHKGGDAGIARPPGSPDTNSKSHDDQHASGSRPAGLEQSTQGEGGVAKNEKPDKCSELIRFDPRTSAWRHGFEVDPNNDPSSKDHRGYYAFKWPLEQIDGERSPRTLLSVVLDTEDLKGDEAGTAGRIQKKQMAWLNDVLNCAGPRDLVLVFGHNAISDVRTEEDTKNPDTEQAAGELDRVLKAHKKNVIAYLFGHAHSHEICRDKRDGKKKNVCNGFWEVQTASLLEFPQEARRIKIKSAGEGMAFLEVVSFREQLDNATDERAKAVELARAAAQRDWCRSQPSARCSEDRRRVQRADGDDTYARLWFKLPGVDGGDR